MNLIHYTSTVSDENMSFRYGTSAEVMRNRARFLETHNVHLKECVAMSSHHGDTCMFVGPADQGRGMSRQDSIHADSLVTNKPGVILFLLTADCLPITLHDTEHRVIGLSHISRHNATKNLMKQTLKFLKKRFNTQPENVIIKIGPSIKKESYIKSSVILKNLEPSWQPFTKTIDSSTSLDLLSFTLHQLQQSGVQKNNIMSSKIDTVTSLDYFSHYRTIKTGMPEGRFATICGMGT